MTTESLKKQKLTAKKKTITRINTLEWTHNQLSFQTASLLKKTRARLKAACLPGTWWELCFWEGNPTSLPLMSTSRISHSIEIFQSTMTLTVRWPLWITPDLWLRVGESNKTSISTKRMMTKSLTLMRTKRLIRKLLTCITSL